MASFHGVTVSTTVWKDNKPVRLASTYVGVERPSHNRKDSEGTVSRFVRATKRRIDVPCPPMVREYNRHMGGVDMADGLIGRYRIRVKTNKYTNRLMYHMVDLALVNAYVFSNVCTKLILNLKCISCRTSAPRSLRCCARIRPQRNRGNLAVLGSFRPKNRRSLSVRTFRHPTRDTTMLAISQKWWLGLGSVRARTQAAHRRHKSDARSAMSTFV